MAGEDDGQGVPLNALLIRIVALEMRAEASEAWQAKYAPIVDALEDKSMIATAIAEATAKTLTNRWTKRHYAVAVAALFVPSLLSALIVILTAHVGGH